MSDTLLVGILSVVGTSLVGVLAYTVNKRSTVNAFTANLLQRLDSVEDQLEQLTGQLTTAQSATIAAVRFIDRLVDWGRRGGGEPMPKPTEELHKYLDPDLWQQAQNGPDA